MDLVQLIESYSLRLLILDTVDLIMHANA